MGYSARYHAASLIAVFIALAVGILVGAEFGGDALNNTRRDLEHSLVGNLQDARSQVDDLNADLNRSDEFAERLGYLRDNGTQHLVLAIGPADGWSAAARQRANLLLSLGRMTLPHQLARVVLAEQVYRALTILAGHPYHSGH